MTLAGLVLAMLFAAPVAHDASAATRPTNVARLQFYDSAGRQLRNTAIEIDATADAGNFVGHGVTNSRGEWSVRFPTGTVVLTAYAHFSYNAGDAIMIAEPIRSLRLPARNPVASFRIATHGLIVGRPGSDWSDYHGGYINIGVGALPADATTDWRVDFQLVPSGGLIDGSPARSYQASLTLGAFKNLTIGAMQLLSTGLIDVPIGTYTLSAELTAPDGRSYSFSVLHNGVPGGRVVFTSIDPSVGPPGLCDELITIGS